MISQEPLAMDSVKGLFEMQIDHAHQIAPIYMSVDIRTSEEPCLDQSCD